MRRATRRPAGHRLGALALGAVAGGALLLGQAGVALAGTPNVTISSPSNGGTVTSATGFAVSGAVSATTSGGSITGPLTVSITNLAGHTGYTTSLPDGWCGHASCNFEVTVPELAWNGAYTVAVGTTETDPQLSPTPGNHQVTVSSSFYQAAPPAPPRSFSAVPASNGGSVALSWAANSEPDLVGYEISRSPASPGSWPAATTGTSFTDDAVQPGVTYAYQVVAVRSGASSGSTVPSSPSGASATTPGPPPTTAGPTGSGTGTGSGSGSGSGATSGASGGSGASGSSGSGTSGSTAGSYFRSQPSGSAPSTAAEASANLSQFQALLSRTRANTAAPALAAPALPPIPEDGVGQPGADNPTVAPFSSGANGSGGARSALVTYENGGGGPSRLQSTAAVALAALLVAIATHLIWLRRQISKPPA